RALSRRRAAADRDGEGGRGLAATSRSHLPRLLWVGTAHNEDASFALTVYDMTRGLAEFSHLEFHPWPPADLRPFVLEQDVVLVGRGRRGRRASWSPAGASRRERRSPL